MYTYPINNSVCVCVCTVDCRNKLKTFNVSILHFLPCYTRDSDIDATVCVVVRVKGERARVAVCTRGNDTDATTLNSSCMHATGHMPLQIE